MSAVLSDCGTYRYRLERDLGGLVGGLTLAWIMVNPSTADATADDATIRKVMGFSRRFGAARIIVGNLFAFRATDIKALRTAVDPIGPKNDDHLTGVMLSADKVVVAWGPCGKLPRHLRARWQRFAGIAQRLRVAPLCIGTALDGHPLHPLMPSYERQLVPWTPPARLASPDATPATPAPKPKRVRVARS